MDTKSKLLQMNRKLAKVIKIGDVDLEIRKPTLGDRAQVIKQAKEAGEIDESGAPQGDAGLMLLARIAQALLFDPATGKRLYETSDLPAIADSVWLEDIQADITAVFSPSEEAARKN